MVAPMTSISRETELSEADQILANLLDLVARRDEAAMGEFYDQTKCLVYGLCLRILREPSAAEDATQDVYMQIWRKAPTFDSARGNALAWIRTISRSRALDKLRSSKVLFCRESPGEELGNFACSEPGPEQNSLLSERAQLIRSSISQMPLIQRRLIEMAFFDGLTQTEIAGQAALPLGTVKSRIRAGMRWLREQLSVLDSHKTDFETRS